MGNTSAKSTRSLVKITSEEKRLLVTSWNAHIQPDEFIGGKIFDQMFSDSPHLKEGFAHFAEIDVSDEHYNEVLQRHGNRVKNAVGIVIGNIHSRKDVRSYLCKLGSRHFKEYKFEPKYIKVMLEYFLISIKDVMGDEWCDELQQAYAKLFELDLPAQNQSIILCI